MEPIACTLTPTALTARTAEICALFEAAVVGVERPAPGQIVWRFRDDANVRARFEALAAAEARCCAFLRFDVGAGAMTITAPAGAEAVLDELFGGRP